MSSHFVLMKTKDEGLHFRQHFDAAMEKFLTNYKGPPSKKCKTDDEVHQRKQEYDRSVLLICIICICLLWAQNWFNKILCYLILYENFSFTGLQCLNGQNMIQYHVTNGVGKICRMYERIGTFITGYRTFKIESIRSHNMSNGHTKAITRMMTITVTTTQIR